MPVKGVLGESAEIKKDNIEQTIFDLNKYKNKLYTQYSMDDPII